jgi:hypothetical protein
VKLTYALMILVSIECFTSIKCFASISKIDQQYVVDQIAKGNETIMDALQLDGKPLKDTDADVATLVAMIKDGHAEPLNDPGLKLVKKKEQRARKNRHFSCPGCIDGNAYPHGFIGRFLTGGGF